MKVKTISALLNKPERWRKGDYEGYRTEDGYLVPIGNRKPNCWCLYGAIEEVYPRSKDQERVEKKLKEAIQQHLKTNRFWGIESFNDRKSTSFEDVQAVLKIAKV